MSGDWIGWINYWSIALACQPTSSSEYVLCCDELSFIVAPKTVSRIHVVVHHLHHQQKQQQQQQRSLVLVSRVISTIRPRAERKLNRQSQMKPITLKWCALDVGDLFLVDLSWTHQTGRRLTNGTTIKLNRVCH